MSHHLLQHRLLHHHLLLLSAAAAVVVAVGCDEGAKGAKGDKGKATSATAVATGSVAAGDDMKAVKAVYKQKCAGCHGALGHGDGTGAKGMKTKPRRLSDAKWRDRVDDEHLRKIIIGGGAAVGRSPAMPAHPDLKNKPEVLAGLVKLIRTFD